MVIMKLTESLKTLCVVNCCCDITSKAQWAQKIKYCDADRDGATLNKDDGVYVTKAPGLCFDIS